MWNVSKYGAFSGLYFPAFGLNNKDKLAREQLPQLRSITGHISWFSSQTRPDVAFESKLWDKHR